MLTQVAKSTVSLRYILELVIVNNDSQHFFQTNYALVLLHG